MTKPTFIPTVTPSRYIGSVLLYISDIVGIFILSLLRPILWMYAVKALFEYQEETTIIPDCNRYVVNHSKVVLLVFLIEQLSGPNEKVAYGFLLIALLYYYSSIVFVNFLYPHDFHLRVNSAM